MLLSSSRRTVSAVCRTPDGESTRSPRSTLGPSLFYNFIMHSNTPLCLLRFQRHKTTPKTDDENSARREKGYQSLEITSNLLDTQRLKSIYRKNFIMVGSPIQKIENRCFPKVESPPKKVLTRITTKKLKMLTDHRLLAHSYNFSTLQNKTIFRAYVCRGNNGDLVKQLLKSRPNWVVLTRKCYSETQFLWTQHRKEEFNQGAHQKQTRHSFSEESHPDLKFITKQMHSKLLYYIPKTKMYSIESKLHNHIEGSNQIGYKDNLFFNLYQTYGKQVWEMVPLTYIIDDAEGEQFKHFTETFTSGTIWIVKPSQRSNRGRGIRIFSQYDQIVKHIFRFQMHGSLVLQQYILNPLLYQNRKFDIRCFVLVSVINGLKKVYWYNDGYLRTSSQNFNLNDLRQEIHLTNDAIQKKFTNYGKFEKGNKVSFKQFDTYFPFFYPKIYGQMKQIAKRTMKCVIDKFDSSRNQFELFGLDFMVDESYKVYLIECNENPCLETPCLFLSKLISTLLDNVFKLTIDVLFYTYDVNYDNNSFEIIYEELF